MISKTSLCQLHHKKHKNNIINTLTFCKNVHTLGFKKKNYNLSTCTPHRSLNVKDRIMRGMASLIDISVP
jgi:hypothetical protein